MDYKITINAILDRADRLGVAKRDLCREGGISASTLHRWQLDDANPRLRDLQETLSKMTAFLDDREKRLRAWLDASERQETGA